MSKRGCFGAGNSKLSIRCALLSQRVEGVVRALAFGFENNLQETPEVAGGPSVLLEPAKVFCGEIVKGAAFEAAERHLP